MKTELTPHQEIQETRPVENNGFQDIKPQNNASVQELNQFWNNEFARQAEMNVPHEQRDGTLEHLEAGRDIQNETKKTEANDPEGLKAEKSEGGKQEINSADVKEQEIKDFIPREEKIETAGRSKGEWSGEIGNSELRPEDETAWDKLKEFGLNGIEYKDGNPDFAPVSAATIELPNMSSNRPENKTNSYPLIADLWNSEAKDGKTDWDARDVKDWKQLNEYDIHECTDMKTVQLIPRDIHMACKHIGGCAECAAKERLEKQASGQREMKGDIFDHE